MTHNLSREAFFKTDSPPCCLRINPLDSSIIYFGTYTLIEGNKRNGSIELWKLADNEVHPDATPDKPDDSIITEHLPLCGEKIKTIPTHGAVLDLKIDPKSNSSSSSSMLLATAHSTGNITLWNIDKLDGTKVSQVLDIQLFPEPTGSEETLITSINFHPKNNYLVFSTTSGLVGFYDYGTGSSSVDENMTIMSSEHSLEAWYADWGHFEPLENVIFSGGDDAKLIAHDIREPMAIMETTRVHDAGIVSILTGRESWCNTVTDPYVIWTGGYDDQLCVLDLRAGVNTTGGSLLHGIPPLVKEKHNLGGGVWRLIPSPHQTDYRVMTCNMYDGGRIVSYNNETAKDVEVVGHYKGEHSSITYGGDWVEDKIVSCSFYDNVVQVWDGKK